MSERKTVLPNGEPATARKAGGALRARPIMSKKGKFGDPVKRPRPVQKQGRGRHGTAVYKPEYAGEAQRLAQAGKNLNDIAEYFNLSPATIKRWMKKHPDFGRGVAYGRVDLQMKSLKSLEKLIEGAEETKLVKKVCEDTGKMEVVGETIIKHKPDTESIKFLLMAQDPEQWAMGGLKGENTMSLVASMAFLETVMKRIPHTSRKALPPPPQHDYPPETYGEASVILDISRNDATRIVPEELVPEELKDD